MRVLIVDDDFEVRLYLNRTMASLGIEQIDVVPSGEDALGKAVVNVYDLVTLDVKMPGVSGLDIISVIRGMMPWAVIAIITGYSEEVTDVARSHADLVFAKPVEFEKIKQLVVLTGELVAKRAAIRELGSGLDG